MDSKPIKISKRTEGYIKKFIDEKKERINKIKNTPVDLSKAQRVG